MDYYCDKLGIDQCKILKLNKGKIFKLRWNLWLIIYL